MRGFLLSLPFLLLTVACDDARPKESPANAKGPASPSAPTAAAPAIKACALLQPEDFQAAGLSQGRAKPEGSMGGGGCTWEPVLGQGGFLHLELITGNQYQKRRERAGDKAVPVTGIGDEAYLSPALVDQGIQVKKGGTYFRIDGNARLMQDKLEPLARAAAARL